MKHHDPVLDARIDTIFDPDDGAWAPPHREEMYLQRLKDLGVPAVSVYVSGQGAIKAVFHERPFERWLNGLEFPVDESGQVHQNTSLF